METSEAWKKICALSRRHNELCRRVNKIFHRNDDKTKTLVAVKYDDYILISPTYRNMGAPWTMYPSTLRTWYGEFIFPVPDLLADDNCAHSNNFRYLSHVALETLYGAGNSVVWAGSPNWDCHTRVTHANEIIRAANKYADLFNLQKTKIPYISEEFEQFLSHAIEYRMRQKWITIGASVGSPTHRL